MRRRIAIGLLLFTVSLLSITLVPSSPKYPTAHAASPTPLLQVWSQDYHSNNITDPTLTPGKTFLVVVNITNAGPIAGFDIQLGYAISPYFYPPISTDSNGVSLDYVPGLFDGSTCPVVTAKREAVPNPYYTVRVAAVFSGQCNTLGAMAGTGTLFSVQFTVKGTNATSIDVQQTGYVIPGKKESLVITSGSTIQAVPNLQVSNMIFQNKPGTLPVAQFTVDPEFPGIGQPISFNGTGSYVPSLQSQSNHGIAKMFWTFGGSGPGARGDFASAGVVSHVFLLSATQNASGYYPARLVVIGPDTKLPMRAEQILYISPGKVHNVAIAINADKTQAKVGDTVGIVVTIANRGNQNENPLLNVSYDFSGTKYLDQNKASSLPIGTRHTVSYSLDTSNLVAKDYTVIATIYVFNNTSTVTTAKVSFILQGTSQSGFFSFSLPVLAVTGIVILAAVLGIVQLIRRRRVKDDSALP